MAVKIENMMKKALKEPETFNPYPYHDQALCNQFVFAIDGPSYDSFSADKALICQIVPKVLWDKKKQYFTEELDISRYLGPNCEDLNGTGSWILHDLPRDPLECAKELVSRGFIWDEKLQLAVNEQPSSDADSWDSDGFEVVPNADIATEINKVMTPEIELEIFEARLQIKEKGLQNGLLEFYRVFRTAPITKESVLLAFLKKHNVPYNASIDKYDADAGIPCSVCWLDKSLLLDYYIKDIPKNTRDKYGRSLLDIAKSYKSIKSEKILLENGFTE